MAAKRGSRPFVRRAESVKMGSNQTFDAADANGRFGPFRTRESGEVERAFAVDWDLQTMRGARYRVDER